MNQILCGINVKERYFEQEAYIMIVKQSQAWGGLIIKLGWLKSLYILLVTHTWMDTYYTYVLRDGEDGSLRQIPRMLQGGYEEGEGWSNMVMLHIRAIIIFSSSILTGSLETSFFFRSHSNTSSYSMCIYSNIDDTNPVLMPLHFSYHFNVYLINSFFWKGGIFFAKHFFCYGCAQIWTLP